MLRIVFYFIYINSNSIYFNPLLVIFGYKFYLAVTEEGNEIYLISKEVIDLNQKKELYLITDYIYLATNFKT
jgi:hypothetical protein